MEILKNGSQFSFYTNLTFIQCVCVCRTVKTTRRGIAVSAALRDSTVWSEVSMTTANPAPVPSPTRRTSKTFYFVLCNDCVHFCYFLKIDFFFLYICLQDNFLKAFSTLASFSPTCVAEGFDDYRCTACPEGYQGKYCERWGTQNDGRF